MRKILILVVILTIIVLAFGVYFSIFKNNKGFEIKKNVKYYPVSITRKAAEDNLSAFEDWKSPQINEIYTMYDTNDNPSAYLFIIKDYYGKAGYLVISATNKTQPLIELSKSETTPYTKLISLESQVAFEERRSPSDLKSQLIYLGNKDYLAKFEVREGSDTKVLYYEINSTELSQLTSDELLQKEEYYNLLQQPDSGISWEKYLD